MRIAAVYDYTCLDTENTPICGFLEANSRKEAVNELIRRGYSPVAIKRRSVLSLTLWQIITSNRQLSAKSLSGLANRLYALSESGLGIQKSLAILTRQSKSESLLSATLRRVRIRVDSGYSLKDALARERRFPAFFISMVDTGQKSGCLPEVFLELARYYEWEDKSLRDVKSALIYPAVVTALIIAAVIMALTMVIPAYAALFEATGAVIPGPTKALMTAGAFVSDHRAQLLLGSAVVISAFVLFMRSRSGIYLSDALRLNLPGLKRIYRMLICYRISNAAGLMLERGVQATSAAESAFSAAGSPLLAETGNMVINEITKGADLGSSFEKIKYFDEIIVNAAKTGEETGNLAFMLISAAKYYKAELERTVKDMSALIEPVITVILGIIICAVLTAVILPSFSL